MNTIKNAFSEDSSPYIINTADIWENERNIVFTENVNEKIAITLISNLQPIIELKGECDFRFDENEKGDDAFKTYYSRKMNIFLESSHDLKALYGIEFFFDSKGNCFSFYTPIEITKNDSNFDYWFALFLRKFDQNIFEIENFLEYQLLINFNNQTEFSTFLKLCLRQHNDILSSKVFQTAQEWLVNKADQNTNITRKNNKGIESNFVPSHSFKLKDVNDLKLYFEEKAIIYSEIMDGLRKHFVHQSTKFQHLKDILSGIKIDPKNRIEWTGSYKELNMFVTILNYDSKKIQPIKNGIWETACYCFIKKGEEIQVDQLSKANGSVQKKNLLIEIVEKL
jgi:hypothetical protein